MFNQDQIFAQLKQLATNSYSPYSHFRVSSIIYLKNQTMIKGVNVESATYTPSICAERVAISQLYTQGYCADDVELLALYTDAIGFGSPCGVCRQVMIELLKPDQKIWIYNQTEFLGEYIISDFVPYPFTNKQLEKK